ncbi:Serrate RNA effector molecule-like [Porphyridium purpureum]|uniref:Serrate RNA effector molecule-like n=1 Tax=Porphyridium purpureum TaxID=35688 RepID=A0A5J4Z0F4_PORPP|nr:Serrate RNA effector molecule-like [Porphyridium purpureum]|eukprot:POR6091..scf208_2
MPSDSGARTRGVAVVNLNTVPKQIHPPLSSHCTPARRTGMDGDELAPKKRPRTDTDDNCPDETSECATGAAKPSSESSAVLLQFFAAHRDEQWFRSRYHPRELREKARLIESQSRRRQAEFFRAMVREGFGDDVPCWPDADASSECRGLVDKVYTTIIHEMSAESLQNQLSLILRPVYEGFGSENSEERAAGNARTLFLRGIPPASTVEEIQSCLEADGSAQVVRVSTSEPHKYTLVRTGLITFASAEDAERAYRYAHTLMRDGTRRIPHFTHIKRNTLSAADGSSALLPCAEIDRMRYDFEIAARLTKHLDMTRGLSEEDNLLLRMDMALLAKLPSLAQRLDVLLHYLFRVHFYAYYAGVYFGEHPELPAPFLSRPINPDQLESLSRCTTVADKVRTIYATSIEGLIKIDFSDPSSLANETASSSVVSRRIDDRARRILRRHRAEKSRHSEISEGVEEGEKAIESWLNECTKMESEERFRCTLPPFKLFKSPVFVHKHLRLKHPDQVAVLQQEVDERLFLENFTKDPQLPFSENTSGDVHRSKSSRTLAKSPSSHSRDIIHSARPKAADDTLVSYDDV